MLSGTMLPSFEASATIGPGTNWYGCQADGSRLISPSKSIRSTFGLKRQDFARGLNFEVVASSRTHFCTSRRAEYIRDYLHRSIVPRETALDDWITTEAEKQSINQVSV